MKTFNEWSQKEALGILPNYEHEPDSNLEGRVVNYYNDSRVRAGDSPNNEADNAGVVGKLGHERFYQTSQAYRRAYDKARAGDSPADKEREHQSNRDTMIRSANDLRNLVKELQWVVDNGEDNNLFQPVGPYAGFPISDRLADVLKDIAQSTQGIADKLHRNTIGVGVGRALS